MSRRVTLVAGLPSDVCFHTNHGVFSLYRPQSQSIRTIYRLELMTKIVAIGRNYAAHAKELNNAVPKGEMRDESS